MRAAPWSFAILVAIASDASLRRTMALVNDAHTVAGSKQVLFSHSRDDCAVFQQVTKVASDCPYRTKLIVGSLFFWTKDF